MMTGRQDEKFPDQPFFNHIRDALWRRPSRASVMVGSGFSRNARKDRPDASDIPLWSDLADGLAKSLLVAGDERVCETDTQHQSASDSALDLAQKYEEYFGRARLHQFLIESVRNEDFSPGEIHRRLLKLPWRDVFTTNWDTLLEQCLPVPEQSYDLVTSVDHLSVTAPPRIVKLHGSFPGAFPLTITRTDYDRYPVVFAPFVNTVQQSMMETVVLLLGFSGEDPNFRRWLNWVQKNLGEAAPRIYLAGWLGLSEPSRTQLMKCNVVPIDLARHPNAGNWPEPLCHSYALKWILLSLELARPYSVEAWPRHLAQTHPSVPAELRPVDSVVARRPEEELWEEAVAKPKQPANLNSIRRVLLNWRHNRRCFPSWLVLPYQAAEEMRANTDHWESLILASLPNLTDGAERLDALSELVWRREAQLDPLLDDIEVAVVGILAEVDCQRRLIGGVELKDLDWQRVRRQWRTLAAALLTVSRFNFDCTEFKHRIDLLKPFMAEDDHVRERVWHERCLWALNHQDFAQLKELVGEWQPRSSDPAWILRKAALLSELGANKESRKLALDVLESVRSWPNDSSSLTGVSREAWALWLAHANHNDTENTVSRLGELEARLRMLGQYRCDPRTEFRAHEMAVVGKHHDEEIKPFDLGITHATRWNFSDMAQRRALASLRAIRFVEVVGSPSVISGGLLHRAAEALLPFKPELASRLTLLCGRGSADRRYSKTLSRCRIAFMPSELAGSLARSQRRTLDIALEELGRVGGVNHGRWVWTHRLEGAMEALSRLVLRLKPDEAESVFRLACSLYCDPRIGSNVPIVFPLANLLRRSWEALPTSLKARNALDLLRLPIIGVDGFTVERELRFQDPGSIMDSALVWLVCPVPERSEANESVWVEVVRLVTKGLQSGGTARKTGCVAASSPWAMAEVLRLRRERQLAGALWDFGSRSNGLPRETNLEASVFLTLPEPEHGLAKRQLRAGWIRSTSWENKPSEVLEEILGSAGAALERVRECRCEINFTTEEMASLNKAFERWAFIGPSRFSPLDLHKILPWRRNVRKMATLLLELEPSSGVAQALFERVRKLGTGKMPAFELTPGIVKGDTGLVDSAARLLKIAVAGTTAEQRIQAKSASEGLHRWLRASAQDESCLPAPPADLVFEIGVIIATHRWCSLSHSLMIAEWVFESGTVEHREMLRQPVLSGLGFLRQVLVFRENTAAHPFVERPEVDEDDVDVPRLRWHCVRLAAAMDSAGIADEAVVTGWLDDAETDPLPEMRFAVEFRHSSQDEINSPDSE